MTKWHVLQCSVNWNQPDAMAFARPANDLNFHKSAYAAVRNYDRIQTSCRVRNGQNTYYDLRVAVSDDGKNYRRLNKAESDRLLEAEDEFLKRHDKVINVPCMTEG